MRAWLSVVRPMSSLLTTLIVSLLWCVKVNTLGIPCKEDLDRAYYPFEQFYLNYCTKFLYSLFNTFILDSSPQTLKHAIGTWYRIFSLCQANSPFCPLQCERVQVFIPFKQTKSLSIKLLVALLSKRALTEWSSLVSIVLISTSRSKEVPVTINLISYRCSL